ncbi:GNAT family N-acetyltransferase [Glaciihabitans sp. dw_435]|uniref:GNAT family N-acetyltransferase n=1 Tax=Glaciihabitans sp. dw_435 TaxID=2720081 RepID=UPI001BD53BE2|nr:hypothetical protein [Glaciihabitans sp. dw_435]
MSEYFIRLATPADVDRLWPLFDESENERLFHADEKALLLAEERREELVKLLLNPTRPVLVAYSGIRAVGYLSEADDTPYVSPSWRSLGVDEELLDHRDLHR